MITNIHPGVYPVVRPGRPVVVLDVRRDLEYGADHLPGAVHIPVHGLRDRLTEVPDGEVWVHCAAGYRASIAASMLAAAGRRIVHVDDDFENAVPGRSPGATGGSGDVDVH